MSPCIQPRLKSFNLLERFFPPVLISCHSLRPELDELSANIFQTDGVTCKTQSKMTWVSKNRVWHSGPVQLHIYVAHRSHSVRNHMDCQNINKAQIPSFISKALSGRALDLLLDIGAADCLLMMSGMLSRSHLVWNVIIQKAWWISLLNFLTVELLSHLMFAAFFSFVVAFSFPHSCSSGLWLAPSFGNENHYSAYHRHHNVVV